VSTGSFGPANDPAFGGDSPIDGAAAEPRPYTTRAYAERPYTTRPYTTRPYTTRPYTTRPYTTRPYTTRPYTTRESGPFDADGRGVLDPLEWSEDVSEAFFGRSALLQLGARLVGVEGAVAIPRLDALKATRNLVNAPTEPDEVRLDIDTRVRPGKLAFSCRVGIDRMQVDELARMPELRWAVKDDIARALVEQTDAALLEAIAATGVTPAKHASGTTATMRAMLEAIAADGPACESTGWLLSPTTLNETTTATPEDTLDASDLAVPYPRDGSSLLGYPFAASAVAGDALWFSWDWSEVWIAVNTRLVTVDVQTKPGEDWTVLGASVRCDVAVRRPELVCTTSPAPQPDERR
jgi:hypothetical protein